MKSFFLKLKNNIPFFSRKKNILFTSYTCSGATWLENCFIELQIRLDTHQNILFKYKAPYNKTLSEYEILPTAEPSKVGLPALTFKDKFYFRNDVFCRFMEHAIPDNPLSRKSKTIVLIRDPRDTLWSEYHICTISSSFTEFVKHRISAWKEFYESCLKIPNSIFLKFENCKIDPITQLQNLLDFCDIQSNIQAIQLAVTNSSSEKAKEAEKIYLENTLPDKRFFKTIFNRSGKINQWKNLPQHAEAFTIIENEALAIMEKFGYETFGSK